MPSREKDLAKSKASHYSFTSRASRPSKVPSKENQLPVSMAQQEPKEHTSDNVEYDMSTMSEDVLDISLDIQKKKKKEKKEI